MTRSLSEYSTAIQVAVDLLNKGENVREWRLTSMGVHSSDLPAVIRAAEARYVNDAIQKFAGIHK